MALQADEALARRRARKRKNTQTWRLKEKQLMESLRHQVANLEEKLQLRTTSQTNVLERQLHALVLQEKALVCQNALLKEALARRTALFMPPHPLPAFRIADPRLYDNVFLVHQIQYILAEITTTVPEALARAIPEKYQEWSTRHNVYGDTFFFDAARNLGNHYIPNIDQACDYHWAILGNKESYLKVNMNAVDFQVVHRAHDDMMVACVTLRLPGHGLATRFIIMYRVRFTHGYHYLCINMSPDLAEVTTSVLYVL
ncbi:hypothetical protein ACHHYP_06158 [Achlya hypogyna]|uniref:Uncharacterized protein n=1 Tax=Achlya hypogyna TaxID=1202772 RepID=A0A1V9YUY9_ACHHY|nr:hypothetical protein ACHHYP_06158 [Achlya hypogyna]